MPSTNRTAFRLLEKSKEAFLLALELYNRPSIRYHVEGCAFFLCNAWELMLKAHLIEIQGEDSIYYKDNPGRTITLSSCISRVFTNQNDPLRVNLEKILELRNTSTHFVTDEFEIFYGPLLQVCVTNFDDKMREFHNFEISSIIPENYLILSVKRDLIEPERIRAKYSPEVAEKLLLLYNSVACGYEDEGSARYAGFYETSFVLTKDPSKADLAVRLEPNAKAGVAFVKEVQKVQDKYPYTTKLAIEEIQKRLNKHHVSVWYKGEIKPFNQFHWQQFVRCYNLKNEERYAYNRSMPKEKQASYVYSQQAIDLVVDAIRKDPEHCIDTIAGKLGKK